MLGILACRKNEDHDKVIERSQKKTKAGKYIIVLEDKDFEKLAKLKLDQEDDEKIDDFMENKLDEIID
jgi:hypothetical protein